MSGPYANYTMVRCSAQLWSMFTSFTIAPDRNLEEEERQRRRQQEEQQDSDLQYALQVSKYVFVPKYCISLQSSSMAFYGNISLCSRPICLRMEISFHAVCEGIVVWKCNYAI